MPSIKMNARERIIASKLLMLLFEGKIYIRKTGIKPNVSLVELKKAFSSFDRLVR